MTLSITDQYFTAGLTASMAPRMKRCCS